MKNRENWQLGLSALLKLGSGENEEQGKESESGMSYRDYVRGLLLLEKRETLSMRALDLIEGDLKIPADNCVMRLEVKSRCHLRRGIWYEFPTYFEYQ